jgi:hypothetical protein
MKQQTLTPQTNPKLDTAIEALEWIVAHARTHGPLANPNKIRQKADEALQQIKEGQ